ncbi:MAG: hypothetical protein ACRD2I_18345 [Vicinamibacterales bacterium]
MMYASYDDRSRSRQDRGPSIYYGYCHQTSRYRMMDLPDFANNIQQGMSRVMTDAQSAYQDMVRGYGAPTRKHDDGCGCGCRERHCSDCHCECCVCDADVLVHARCGEVRRIPVTFENDSRRDRQVKLELEKFVTAGGRELKWGAQLSDAEFTLKPCDEKTIVVSVLVNCDTFTGDQTPGTTTVEPNLPAGSLNINRQAATAERLGSVDRCEVAYATLRAEGCSVRPVVLAVAVLPDDCDDYRRPCSCGCCH